MVEQKKLQLNCYLDDDPIPTVGYFSNGDVWDDVRRLVMKDKNIPSKGNYLQLKHIHLRHRKDGPLITDIALRERTDHPIDIFATYPKEAELEKALEEKVFRDADEPDSITRLIELFLRKLDLQKNKVGAEGVRWYTTETGRTYHMRRGCYGASSPHLGRPRGYHPCTYCGYLYLEEKTK